MRVTWESICAEIEAKPRLTAEEERALWSAWRDGSERAREELIACTMRYALGHARKLAKPGQRWEPGDLLGEAVQAIAGALDRWDGSGSFAGYASARIRGAMADFLRRRADVLRTPTGSERVLSLDAPDDDDGPGLHERTGTVEIEAPDLPALTPSELKILSLTVLATPPGTPEEAAKALGLSVTTVDRRLRTALRKSAAT
jgi:RNA polymerase sigma factor (sigma-70 family)